MDYKDYYGRSASSATRPRRRSRRPTASWRASSTRTSTRTRAPRPASRRSPRPTRSSRTPRSAPSTTSSARPGSSVRAGRRRRRRAGSGFDFGGGFGGSESVDFGGFGGGGGPARPAASARFFEMLFGSAAAAAAAAGGAAARAGGGRADWPRRGGDQEAAHRADARGGGARAASARSRSPIRGPASRRRSQVKIPRGIRPGQRIRLAGKGEPAAAADRRATSTCSVELAAAPRFRLEGERPAHDAAESRRGRRRSAANAAARRRSTAPVTVKHPGRLLVGAPDPPARQGLPAGRRRARRPLRRAADRGARSSSTDRERELFERAARRSPTSIRAGDDRAATTAPKG